VSRLRVVPLDATGVPDEAHAVELDPAGEGDTVVDLGRGRFRVTAGEGTDGLAAGGHVAELPVRSGEPRRFEAVVDGWRFELEVEDAGRAAIRRRGTREADAASASGPLDIRAIIPGRVAGVRVAPGDAVEAGQTLLVVEAMKMQNELRAPRDGTVGRVAAGEGQTIERGDLLLVLE
jgi:biotin carboxyl carrier protein